MAIISREKGNSVSVEEYSEFASGEYFGGIVSKVWQDYEIALKKENALDFDDLLLVQPNFYKKKKLGEPIQKNGNTFT